MDLLGQVICTLNLMLETGQQNRSEGDHTISPKKKETVITESQDKKIEQVCSIFIFT